MAGEFRTKPPPDGRTETLSVRYDWSSISEATRARPNEWLLVDDEAGQYLVNRIRDGKPRSLQADGWVFDAVGRKYRTTDEGTRVCELWITAIPDERSST